MQKKKVTLSLDHEIVEKIKQVAKIEQRSISQQVNKILIDFLLAAKSKLPSNVD